MGKIIRYSVLDLDAAVSLRASTNYTPLQGVGDSSDVRRTILHILSTTDWSTISTSGTYGITLQCADVYEEGDSTVYSIDILVNAFVLRTDNGEFSHYADINFED